MLTLGSLGFAAPWALVAFIALPALWMLLRATPPAPNTVMFAPLRLLQRLARTPETPQTTPWWLIALRLFMAALIILALARPVLRPDGPVVSDSPLLVIVDDGWAAAGQWSPISQAARAQLEAARADGRSTALVFSSDTSNPAELIQFGNAARSLARLDAHDPSPIAPELTFVYEKMVTSMAADGAIRRFDTVWLSDGIDWPGAAELARAASQAGRLQVIAPPAEEAALALVGVTAQPDGFTARVVRLDDQSVRPVSLTALGADGRAVARANGEFAVGETRLDVSARLPLDLRNRISRIQIDGLTSAGAVHLTGDRWRRPRVGLVTPPGGEGQPLLSDAHYAREALAGSAEIVSGDLESVLASEPAALVLVDAAPSSDPAVLEFLEAGGLVIRFAGPRLAANPDTLLPIPLRQGGRLFGGALAWDEAQKLAPFPDDSPFAGLAVPDEASVERQVLAEPGPALNAHVWARLDDGTPLVTADRRGDGWLVLYHVTAGPAWSSLPLSGAFPALLERTLSLADTSRVPTPSAGSWRLETALSGRGDLTDPGAGAMPIEAGLLSTTPASADHPPGIYTLGAASAALNAVTAQTRLEPLSRTLPGAVYQTRGSFVEQRFAGLLLTFALLLLVIDTLIALALAGRLPRLRAGPVASRAAALVLASVWAVSVTPMDALAQDGDLGPAENALQVRLAYVITGDARIDSMSQAGLASLSRESTRRSAVEPAAPVGVRVESDEFIYFPVLYWPLTLDAPALSADGSAKVSAYLQAGGLILFDTRDGQETALRREPHPGLVRTLADVELPPLEPAPSDHVLGRSFYLLDEFPGRYPGGTVWVEAAGAGASRDGVSGVVIGSADWAAAWAMDENGTPLAPVEGGPRQRELAIRFGVNLAMYALTGNYKADQVHVPAILERLGQE